jgi:hypothetical protein
VHTMFQRKLEDEFFSRVSNVGRYLPLFLVKTKIKKISIIILEERCLIRILSVLKH